MKSQNQVKSMFVPLLIVSLWVVTLITAIGVIYSTYQSRQSMQELEDLRRTASGLHVESGQYLLEKSALSAYARVERIADKKLKMEQPSAKNTVLVYKE